MFLGVWKKKQKEEKRDRENKFCLKGTPCPAFDGIWGASDRGKRGKKTEESARRIASTRLHRINQRSSL